ncbi:MAG: beta-ketoacyl synthase N-terminal-like domain-containing protein [Rikenellaceae bacterium]
MDREVIVAYCGAREVICSLGNNLKECFGAMERYETALSSFDDGTPLCRIDRERLDTKGLEEYTFAEQLSILALRSISSRSGVKIDNDRTALIISTTKGNIDTINCDFERSYLWAMGDKIASYFGYKGAVTIVSNACVSGVSAVAIGARMIENAEVDRAFVVGVDIVSEFVVSGFNSFKSISAEVCKPYDKSRDGLTLGEGCGAILLSCEPNVDGDNIVVSGYGMSDDANHISGPSRTGDGLFFAIDSAMQRAGVDCGDIGLINAHGTATPFNDDMESKAIAWAELTASPCNSLKPYIGHTLGASGVIEINIAIEQMLRSKVLSVKGYEESGVPFELNVSARHRDLEINHALKCASGFGGTNAAIVLSKAEVSQSLKRGRYADGLVECGSVMMRNIGEESAADTLKREYKTLGDANLKFYKMNNLAKAGYVASCKLLKGVELSYEPNRVAVVLANRSGSLDADLNHQEIVDKHLPEGASPTIFVYTLANIVAAEVAIKHKLQGEVTMFVMEQKDMKFLERYSHQLIALGECDAVVYGWCELLKNEYDIELKLIKHI